jgi:hypothetical protein
MTPSVPYRCENIAVLPFKGTEILVLATLLICFAFCFGVTFIDLIIKQLWPAKFLDATVAARVAAIQKKFPNLGQEEGDSAEGDSTSIADDDLYTALTVKKHFAEGANGEQVDYDAVCSTEPYIAGRSVDEDLTIMLANGKAFSTVSSYCTCTVRGYNMLSVMLVSAGVNMSYLWVHNAPVDARTDNWMGYLALVGYLFVFLTGMVMCGPTRNAVNRRANIFMWSSIPLEGAPEKMLRLHGIGIGAFGLVPLLMHVLQALAWGKDKMPNYAVTMSMFWLALAFGILFFLFSNAKYAKCFFKVGAVTAAKLAVAFEFAVLFCCFVEFIQFETYATAACAGATAYWTKLLLAAMFAPFAAFIAKHQLWAPTAYELEPSLMLMKRGRPVALSGPCAAAAFNQVPGTGNLPIVQ